MKVEPNRALFQKLCCDFVTHEQERFNIGTYKEKKLHIIMKHYFEPDHDYHEVPFNGYIADIKRGGEITEIETHGFSGLNPKLSAFLPECTVNLVYPMPYRKNIAWIDPKTGDISPRRRSPKKTDVYDAAFEMVRIVRHINDPNLTVTAVLLELDEYRLLNGWSKDRKKGSERYERIPSELYGIVKFKTNADYAELIPESCTEDFTAGEFAKAAGISTRKVYAVLKVLEARGLLVRGGKRGRAQLFSRFDVTETEL